MKHDLNNKNFERKAKRVYSVFACIALLLAVTAVPALAADDPLTVVNNLSDFIFSLIRAMRGPRIADRILGINMTGSLTTAMIAVLALLLEQSWLLDVCLIYCMISFLAVIVLAKVRIAFHEEGKEETDD